MTARVWQAAPDEAREVAGLLAAFRDHMGYDGPDDAAFLASAERLIGRDDSETSPTTLAGRGWAVR